MEVCVHCTFGQFGFVSNAVEIYSTENVHGIQCTNDIINAMHEGIKHRTSTSITIKYFSFQFDINGINKDTEY